MFLPNKAVRFALLKMFFDNKLVGFGIDFKTLPIKLVHFALI